MQRWRPNQRQWWGIWLTIVPALLLWIDGAERLAAAVTIVGGLLVWQFGTRRKSPQAAEESPHAGQEIVADEIARLREDVWTVRDVLLRIEEVLRQTDGPVEDALLRVEAALERPGCIEGEVRPVRQELAEITDLLKDIRGVLEDTRTDARVARQADSSKS
jgi:hypothetical protein